MMEVVQCNQLDTRYLTKHVRKPITGMKYCYLLLSFWKLSFDEWKSVLLSPYINLHSYYNCYFVNESFG